MVLYTERLRLSELDWKDVEFIHEMNCFKEVERFNTIGIPETVVQTQAMLKPIIEDKKNETRTKYSWVIRKKDTNDFVGEIGLKLSLEKFNSAEMYYSLLPKYWGIGYATESAKACIKFGFETLRLHRIEAGVSTENIKSIRILEKVGMTKEGIRRKILPIRGEWKDNYLFAILDEDKRDY